MKTITVLSLKSGTGKTTVCLSLAFAARQAGLKVVVADIDPRRAVGDVLGDRPEAASLLIETGANKLRILQDACRRNGCDLLIVDTPAAPQADVGLAVEIADLSLAVTRPGLLDLIAAMRTTRLLRHAGVRAAVLLNNCPTRRAAGPATLRARAAAALLFSGVPLAQTRLGRRPTYHQAFASQEGVSERDPWRAFAADVMQLLGETMGGLLWAKGASAGPALEASAAGAGRMEGPRASERLDGLRAGVLADLTTGPAEAPAAAIERWERFADDPASDFAIPSPGARQPWRHRSPTRWPTSAAA